MTVLTMDIAQLETGIQSALGITVQLAVANEPISLEQLSEPEREELSRFKSKVRRQSWLTGRNALKQLKIQGPFELIFPNAGLSISHSGHIAVAARVDDPSILGFGIDLEIGRFPKPESARFFLNPEERRFVESNDHLLQLWTIKEALFKANTGKRIPLFGFRLRNPGKSCGKAEPNDMFYAAFPVPGGYFSAAILL